MKKEIKIPNLGDNISSVDIVKILVKKGDKVSKDDILIEVGSDKANIEIPSEFDGIIDSILVNEGDSVKNEQSLLIIDIQDSSSISSEDTKPEEKVQATKVEITQKEEVKVAPVQVDTQKIETNQSVLNIQKVPNIGDNVSSAEIVKILVKIGDKVLKDAPIIELGSDKANIEITSEFDGIVKEIFVKEGDNVTATNNLISFESIENVIQPIIKNETIEIQVQENIKKDEIKLEIKEDRTILDTTNESLKIKGSVAPAAPSVRRFSREIGIDINKVKGTGANNRISIEDVKLFAKNLNSKPIELQTIQRSSYHEELPDFSKWGEVSKETMNSVRYKTVQHLSFAWNTIPHVTNFEKVDITELEKLRKQYAKKAEALSTKLTITGILAKVITSALKLFPKFNSSIDVEKKEIIFKKYYNIGIAVDTDRGLLVPVIKNTDKKNVLDISVDLSKIAEKARNKKLTMDDMQGATFTISNLGGIGGVGFTPIINSPEVAIIGVSQSSYEPVYIDNNFVPRLIMPLSISYDHRIIDGADAARFMKWIKEALENPFLLMLEG
ncbi:MAG: 2-oxo acid dehydrogenase subunit E2 [Cyanobacteriota bacterium]